MFLLDTNVISELRKPKPHGGVFAWAQSTPQQLLNICSITLMELQDGVLATRKQNPERAAEIESWVDELESTFDVLPFGGKAARITSRLMLGTPGELFEDAMIAAIAISHGMTVATRNARHFERFDVPLINPFQYKC